MKTNEEIIEAANLALEQWNADLKRKTQTSKQKEYLALKERFPDLIQDGGGYSLAGMKCRSYLKNSQYENCLNWYLVFENYAVKSMAGFAHMLRCIEEKRLVKAEYDSLGWFSKLWITNPAKNGLSSVYFIDI